MASSQLNPCTPSVSSLSPTFAPPYKGAFHRRRRPSITVRRPPLAQRTMTSCAHTGELGVVSKRVQNVKPFVVMQVLQAAYEKEAQLADAAHDERVLHLEVGQPCTGAPEQVIEAAVHALRTDKIAYTESFGELELRNRIARFYEESYGVHVLPHHVAVTAGSSAAFVGLFATCFDAGQRVAVAVPGYPCYRNILSALGIQVVSIPVSRDNSYQLTVEHLQLAVREHGALAGVIVASPSNPTGTILSYDRLEQLVEFCEDNAITFISDEIYHGIVRSHTPTALQISDKAIVINSFSKYFSMTGYRLGWVINKDAHIQESLERVLQNMFISAPTVSQKAALAAFDCRDVLDMHVARYFKSLDTLAAALPSMGFTELYEPSGAFYLYANCSQILSQLALSSSVQLCSMLLQELAVATTPGVDFDPERGHLYIRFSCAGATEDIALACTRMQAWLNEKRNARAHGLDLNGTRDVARQHQEQTQS